jgi:hypothetical protein
MVALVAAMSTIGASCAQGAKGALDDGVRWASEATGTSQATLQGLVDARPALGEALSSAEAGEISRLIVQQWDSVPVALICDQLSRNPKKLDALVGDLSMAPDAPGSHRRGERRTDPEGLRGATGSRWVVSVLIQAHTHPNDRP